MDPGVHGANPCIGLFRESLGGLGAIGNLPTYAVNGRRFLCQDGLWFHALPGKAAARSRQKLTLENFGNLKESATRFRRATEHDVAVKRWPDHVRAQRLQCRKGR